MTSLRQYEIIPIPGADRVDVNTVADLFSGVVDSAAAVTERGIGRRERLSRARLAAEHERNVAGVVEGMNPYRDGQFARIADMLAIAGRSHWRPAAGSLDDAAERLALADQYEATRNQLRAMPNLAGLFTHPTSTAGPTPIPSTTPWLDNFASPASHIGPPTLMPEPWSAIPQAAIDEDPQAPGEPLATEGDPLGWHTSRWMINEAAQVVDWTVQGAADLERVVALIVNQGLERVLMADLIAGAPTQAGFEEAESAVGDVWPAGPDLILCSGHDLPRVRREYAGQHLDPSERPRIVATAGATTGTAVVLARGGVLLEATELRWMIVVEPKVLGREVMAYRYGRARRRITGAVQLVPVN